MQSTFGAGGALVELFVWILSGGLSGWAVAMVLGGAERGVAGNMIVGAAGAVVTGSMLPMFGIPLDGSLAYVFAVTAGGASLLLLATRVARGL